MFDLQLSFGHLQLATIELGGDFALLCSEVFHLPVLQGADRDHRQTWVDLNRGDGITGGGPKEGLFEVWMRDAFVRADEARSELDADGTHFEVSRNGLAAPDPARD